jgi:hypothetical protein
MINTKEYITSSGNEWKVHAKNGKVLGTHSTKTDAVKQLQAIEINKHKEELSGKEEREINEKNKKATKKFGKLYDDLTQDEKNRLEEKVIFTSAVSQDLWVVK